MKLLPYLALLVSLLVLPYVKAQTSDDDYTYYTYFVSDDSDASDASDYGSADFRDAIWKLAECYEEIDLSGSSQEIADAFAACLQSIAGELDGYAYFVYQVCIEAGVEFSEDIEADSWGNAELTAWLVQEWEIAVNVDIEVAIGFATETYVATQSYVNEWFLEDLYVYCYGWEDLSPEQLKLDTIDFITSIDERFIYFYGEQILFLYESYGLTVDWDAFVGLDAAGYITLWQSTVESISTEVLVSYVEESVEWTFEECYYIELSYQLEIWVEYDGDGASLLAYIQSYLAGLDDLRLLISAEALIDGLQAAGASLPSIDFDSLSVTDLWFYLNSNVYTISVSEFSSYTSSITVAYQEESFRYYSETFLFYIEAWTVEVGGGAQAELVAFLESITVSDYEYFGAWCIDFFESELEYSWSQVYVWTSMSYYEIKTTLIYEIGLVTEEDLIDLLDYAIDLLEDYLSTDYSSDSSDFDVTDGSEDSEASDSTGDSSDEGDSTESTGDKESSDSTGDSDSSDSTGESDSSDSTGESDSSDSTGDSESSDSTGDSESSDSDGDSDSSDSTGDSESEDSTGDSESEDSTGDSDSSDSTGDSESEDSTGDSESEDSTGDSESEDSTVDSDSEDSTGDSEDSTGDSESGESTGETVDSTLDSGESIDTTGESDEVSESESLSLETSDEESVESSESESEIESTDEKSQESTESLEGTTEKPTDYEHYKILFIQFCLTLVQEGTASSSFAVEIHGFIAGQASQEEQIIYAEICLQYLKDIQIEFSFAHNLADQSIAEVLEELLALLQSFEHRIIYSFVYIITESSYSSFVEVSYTDRETAFAEFLVSIFSISYQEIYNQLISYSSGLDVSFQYQWCAVIYQQSVTQAEFDLELDVLWDIDSTEYIFSAISTALRLHTSSELRLFIEGIYKRITGNSVPGTPDVNQGCADAFEANEYTEEQTVSLVKFESEITTSFTSVTSFYSEIGSVTDTTAASVISGFFESVSAGLSGILTTNPTANSARTRIVEALPINIVAACRKVKLEKTVKKSVKIEIKSYKKEVKTFKKTGA